MKCFYLTLLLSAFTQSCTWIKEHPDSAPEEAIEALIQEATGLDIDLTSTDGV